MKSRHWNMRGWGIASRSFLRICAILAVFSVGIRGIGSAEAKPSRILAFGTSLTQGYNLPPGTDFCVVLEAKLRAKGHDVTIINAGVSGDTSAGGLARLDWILQDPVDGVILELGSNDALRSFSVRQLESNLDQILTTLKARRLPVLLAGMKSPRNLGPEYVRAFEAVFPSLAKKHKVLFFPFFLEGVAADPKLNQKDGIHPNEEGTKIIVKNILPYAEKLIAEINAAPTK